MKIKTRFFLIFFAFSLFLLPYLAHSTMSLKLFTIHGQGTDQEYSRFCQSQGYDTYGSIFKNSDGSFFKTNEGKFALSCIKLGPEQSILNVADMTRSLQEILSSVPACGKSDLSSEALRIKILHKDYLFRHCMEAIHDEKTCNEELGFDFTEFNAYDWVRARSTATATEREKYYQEYGGLIVLRDPNKTENTELILTCGNDPTIAQINIYTRQTNYAEKHLHPGADTINIDPSFNPSLIGSILDAKHMGFIQKKYDVIQFETPDRILHQKPVFLEILRMLKPGGVYKMGRPPEILMEMTSSEVRTSTETGPQVIEHWKTLRVSDSYTEKDNVLESDAIYGAGPGEVHYDFVNPKGPDETTEKQITEYFKGLGFSDVQFDRIEVRGKPSFNIRVIK